MGADEPGPEAAPLFGAWRTWYLLVLGALAATIAGLAILTAVLS